jgi:hypothetical protein
MSTSRGRVLPVLLALALVAGCAEPAPPPPPPPPVPTPAPAPVRVTCSVEVTAPPPAEQADAGTPAGTATGGPEVAPHQAENNGWKERRPLSKGDHEAASAAAAKLDPALRDVCARQDYTVDAVREVLLDKGFAADAFGVTGLRQPLSGEAATGVVYELRVGGACVVGDLRPHRLRTWIEGPTREGGCLEPVTH